MLNLVWDEVQDESSRNSQPHIGSDGAGTKGFTHLRQDLQGHFSVKRLQTADWPLQTACRRQLVQRHIASAKENMPYSIATASRNNMAEVQTWISVAPHKVIPFTESNNVPSAAFITRIARISQKVATMEDPVNDNMPKGGFVFIIIGKAYVEDDNEGIDIHVMLRAPDDDSAVRDALNALTEEGFAEADLDQIGTLMGAPDEEPHASAYQGALEGEVAIIRFG